MHEGEDVLQYKKRRFSAFISNNYIHSSQHKDKRLSPTPTRVLLVGRPKVGKSSVASMLINRDVIPGTNPLGIFVNDIPSEETSTQDCFEDGATIDVDDIIMASTTPPDEYPIRTSFSTLASEYPDSTPLPIKSRTNTFGGNGDLPPVIPPPAPQNAKPTVFQSDKYIVTDIQGLQEGSTDVIGRILELRRWLEESQQGYNIILMVLQAQPLTETDRRIYALCNALLHDMRDLIHLVVTGCDSNPKWIEENQEELKRIYGTSKAIGVAFPTMTSGILASIFEEIRKESLIVLEDYIQKNMVTPPRIPTKATRGGSAGANIPKTRPTRSKSRSLSSAK